MSSLLPVYEDDFNETAEQVRDVLTKLQSSLDRSKDAYQPPPTTGPESRSQQGHTLQQGISHLRELLTNMSYECNDIEPPAVKEEVKLRVDDYRRVVTLLDKEVTRARQEAREADRLDLMNGGGSNVVGEEGITDERSRMLGTTGRLREGTGVLNKAEALLHSTNEMGLETLSTIRGQTEQMRTIHTAVIDVDTDVVDIRGILHRMQQAARNEKIIFAGVVALLLVTVLIMIFV
uniref:WGS project CAEQ00000000 data, annotated contig 20 n=1 Tax=Trypanosoma congolense (strain IL3000) TaxID=1068625 RepID=F9WAT5_TRYCI|nr:unnamed protein product [Trypanosoma congolense IL3000]